MSDYRGGYSFLPRGWRHFKYKESGGGKKASCGAIWRNITEGRCSFLLLKSSSLQRIKHSIQYTNPQSETGKGMLS